MTHLILFVSCIFFLTGCGKKDSYKSENATIYKAEELPADLKVPLVMWEFFDNLDGFIFTESKLWLKEKNSGVLRNDAMAIEFPKGGGEVNFSSLRGKENGSFFLGMEMAEFAEASMVKVLFISHAKKRRIDGEIWGSGCNKVLDITEEFMKAMKGSGLKLNTTRDRHLTVAGGTFILAATKDGQNFISQITIKDSEKMDLACAEAL